MSIVMMTSSTGSREMGSTALPCAGRGSNLATSASVLLLSHITQYCASSSTGRHKATPTLSAPAGPNLQRHHGDVRGRADSHRRSPEPRAACDVQLRVVHRRQSSEGRLREPDDVVKGPHLATMRVAGQLQVDPAGSG